MSGRDFPKFSIGHEGDDVVAGPEVFTIMVVADFD